MAICAACERIGSFDLSGCDLYASAEPCPMCYAAACSAKVRHIYYASKREDVVAVGFRDDVVQEAVLSQEAQMPTDSPARVPVHRVDDSHAHEALDEWRAKPDKVAY